MENEQMICPKAKKCTVWDFPEKECTHAVKHEHNAGCDAEYGCFECVPVEVEK